MVRWEIQPLIRIDHRALQRLRKLDHQPQALGRARGAARHDHGIFGGSQHLRCFGDGA